MIKNYQEAVNSIMAGFSEEQLKEALLNGGLIW